MFKRKKEEIKTMHALGKTGYKQAKENIRDIGKKKTDYSQFSLDPDIFSELVSIAMVVLSSNRDASPDKILEKFENHKRVKRLLEKDVVNQGDLRDALDEAMNRIYK
ncbi:MAG: hypothetical protein HZB65_00815 [Candidatus Aenigmarchaeota archaeon]|nr:hypothetical protein [Candidatus Aenigmarchaeota archaeon]